MKDVFKKVTNELIDQLKLIQSGDAPARWFKPWTAGALPDFPSNQLTGSEYHGMNALLLYMTSLSKGYRTNKWLTFKQKNSLASQIEADLRIRKGEHGMPIFRYVEWMPQDAPVDSKGNPKKAVALKQFTVFNVDQLENVPEELLPVYEEPDWDKRYAQAHRFLDKLPCPTVQADRDKAFYTPAEHRIVVPPLARFKSETDYLATLFHEHVHSTAGAVERKIERGEDNYAREELVAEIGSALLCAHFGIEAKMQHPEYINSWISRLQHNDKEFWQAASQSQKAVTYLMQYAPKEVMDG